MIIVDLDPFGWFVVETIDFINTTLGNIDVQRGANLKSWISRP